jgi:hypothetical protein
MNYNTLLGYFVSEESLNKLLEKCQEAFDGIDKLNEQLQEGMLSDNPDSCRLALERATGYYSFLSPITKVAEGIKKNEEGRFYCLRKSQYERGEVVVKVPPKKEGEKETIQVSKFTDASCTRESEVAVIVYRNVRNILMGYLNSSDAIKGSCQSILKSLEKEKNV